MRTKLRSMCGGDKWLHTSAAGEGMAIECGSDLAFVAVGALRSVGKIEPPAHPQEVPPAKLSDAVTQEPLKPTATTAPPRQPQAAKTIQPPRQPRAAKPRQPQAATLRVVGGSQALAEAATEEEIELGSKVALWVRTLVIGQEILVVQRTLAAKIGCNHSSVQKGLAALAARGVVRVAASATGTRITRLK